MTRKDYQLIAAAINGVYDSIAENTDANSSHTTGVDIVMYAIASALAEDNPRFSFELFLTACKGEQ